jgi:hypothetical protein
VWQWQWLNYVLQCRQGEFTGYLLVSSTEWDDLRGLAVACTTQRQFSHLQGMDPLQPGSQAGPTGLAKSQQRHR